MRRSVFSPNRDSFPPSSNYNIQSSPKETRSMFRTARSLITIAGFALVLAGICFATAIIGCVQAQEKITLPSQPIHVYLHPTKLTAQDKLQDLDTVIDIEGETSLIWVDLMPNARFSHPTEYILISAEGTRVMRGITGVARNNGFSTVCFGPLKTCLHSLPRFAWPNGTQSLTRFS